MTDGKRVQLIELGPRWTVDPAGPWTAAALAAAFGRIAPLHLDIGVGDGASTRHWAHAVPEADVLAVELHRPGVSRLLGQLDATGPANVRVAMADACVVLQELEPGSIAHLRVLFPDPWPKRRHVARRLVDRAFVAAAADALAPGGVLHLATDWTDYADQMRSMAATEPRLVPRPDGPAGATGAWQSPRPDRPVTAYERRGVTAGRTITDLIWERRSD
ncbi:tRNA (guanosine(46)-N7)-methyltransferase TrmB [Aquihabitans daechungensis]|uniref:tRNA (guanosine(46)-N7)-methyltransferase TrmB n=1 Tax=Aquihabitans daechungensis TaxID=1052257 RepID=UPI003B9ECA2D